MEKDQKTLIREKILTLLRNQKEEDRVRKSRIILEKMFSLPEFQCSQTILFYASFDGEVDTFEMMKQAQKRDKQIALPIIEEKSIVPRRIQSLASGLEVGPYGVKQPRQESSVALDFRELDLVVVPGLAFDKENNRLGRGKGYYDRFLRALPSRISSIGLAFDFQILDSLPHHQEHDMPVSRVIVN
ncbi:MAG: 5-formyltetrahydrofolate cyclo-ligase [Candidatus Omnitrophota bacterium]